MFAGVPGKAGNTDQFVRQTALFSGPTGIAVNPQTSDIYVSDFNNHAIRKITPEGTLLSTALIRYSLLFLLFILKKGEVSTLAGSKHNNSGNSNGARSQVGSPMGLVFLPTEQSLIVCDRESERLQKVTLDGNSISNIKIASLLLL